MINPRYITGLDELMLEELKVGHRIVVTLEDGVLDGGFGEKIARYYGNRELAVVNTKYLQNLAYCRLKNLSIGYTLPDKWLSKIGFEKIRVYFSGENLLTFTKLHSDYIDPEQASASNSWKTSKSDANIYPWAKTTAVL